MKKILVGLEAETFVLNKDNELVICSDFPHDSFPLLLEIRGLPGKNYEEVLSNFYKEYFYLLGLLERCDLKMDLSSTKEVDKSLYNECIKQMPAESKGLVKNIYGKDIDISNVITDENGKIIKRVVQAGLHIHISAILEEDLYQENEERFVPFSFNFNISIGDKEFVPAKIDNLYQRVYSTGKTRMKKFVYNLLNYPIKSYIIKSLDEKLFDMFCEESGKYRQKGMYEEKDDGRIEYRSLPFNQYVFEKLPKIVSTVFEVTNEI